MRDHLRFGAVRPLEEIHRHRLVDDVRLDLPDGHVPCAGSVEEPPERPEALLDDPSQLRNEPAEELLPGAERMNPRPRERNPGALPGEFYFGAFGEFSSGSDNPDHRPDQG